MSIFSTVFSFFNQAQNASTEEIEKQIPKEKIETSRTQPFGEADNNPIPAFELENWKFLDAQARSRALDHFKRCLKSLYLEEEISDFLDIAIRNNAILSKAYTDHLTACDTPIHTTIQIEGLTEEESKEVFLQARNKINKLYPHCSTDRDTSKFVIGNLLRYGLFSSQQWFNESTGELEEIRLIAPWSIRWEKSPANGWLPFVHLTTKQYVHPKGFVYSPAFPVVNDKGVFFLPPYLAGLAHVPSFEILNQSVDNLGRNIGYQKIVQVETDPSVLEILRQDNGQSKINNKTLPEYLKNVIEGIANIINGKFQVGAMGVSPGLKVDTGNSFDLPSNFMEFKNMILTDMALGFKSYLSSLGIPGQTNQTTLSEAQKKMLKNFINTIQHSELSVYKSDTLACLAGQGYVVQSWKAWHEPPRFDNELQEETARGKRLENDRLESLSNEAVSEESNEEGNE